MIAEVDPGSIGTFIFPNFLTMMMRKLDENSAEDEIREAFKVFDNVTNIFFFNSELFNDILTLFCRPGLCTIIVWK